MPRLLPLLFGFVLCLAPLPAQTSVWKVTRGDAVLYLGGTCHVLRPGDFPLPTGFDIAYAASSKLVFETDIRRVTSPEMQSAFATEGMFTDGTTLEDVLTPSAWNALRTYSQEAGLPIAQMKRMKPWLFTLMMTALEMQKLGFSPEGVDLHYFKKASADGKAVGELETFEQQMAFITQLGAGHESELIEKSIEDLHELPKLIDDVLVAWKTGDMPALDKLMLDDVRTDYPSIFKSIFVDRNTAWLPKIEALLETPEVEFVLVGAGHLPGSDGVLALLRSRGWQLDQIEAAHAATLPKVLFFANPMRSDNDVIRRATPAERSIAERHFAALSDGVFDITITQDGSEVTREKLGHYDAVVFFTAINPPGVDVDALIKWVRSGGAFAGIHSTANTFQKHPGFGEMLGARFDRRPWRTPKAPQTEVRVKVHDATHPATRHLGDSFEIADDIYQFKDFDRNDVQLLLGLDPESLDLTQPKVNRSDRVFPVAWTKPFGNGRVFYTALGDWEPTWKDPRFRTHLVQGILWAMKRAKE